MVGMSHSLELVQLTWTNLFYEVTTKNYKIIILTKICHTCSTGEWSIYMFFLQIVKRNAQLLLSWLRRFCAAALEPAAQARRLFWRPQVDRLAGYQLGLMDLVGL